MNYLRLYFKTLRSSITEILLAWVCFTVLGEAGETKYSTIELMGISLLFSIVLFTLIFLYNLSRIKILK